MITAPNALLIALMASVTGSSSLGERRIAQQHALLALVAERDGGLSAGAGAGDGHDDPLTPALVEHGVAGHQDGWLAPGGRLGLDRAALRLLLLERPDQV